MAVAASPSEMRRLAQGISQTMAGVCASNASIESALNALGGSWGDEGYQTIKDFVMRSHKNVEAVVPDIQLVCSKLIQVAELLEQAQRATQ